MPYVVSSIHPAYCLHGAKPITEEISKDLAKAWRIANEGPRQNFNIIPVLPQHPAGLEWAFHAALTWLRHWRWLRCAIVIDVETSSLEYFNCKLHSVGLSGIDGNNVSVAFTCIDFHTLPWEMEIALVAELQAICADENIVKVFHNEPFDGPVLARKGMPVRGKILCTQALKHLDQPDVPKSLDWVAQSYIDCRPWKVDHAGKKRVFTKDPLELVYYNGEDALYTGLVVEPLLQDLQHRGISQKLISMQMEYARLAEDMELWGLPINHSLRRQMGMALLKEMWETKHWMREFLGWNDFNPMSDDHRRTALFTSKYVSAPWNLGIQATRRTEKQGLPSTGYRSIIDHLEHPFVRRLATYIEDRHAYATMYRESAAVEAWKYRQLGLEEEALTTEEKNLDDGAYQRAICSDGFLHSKVNPTGQKGSRFSTSPNNQNIKDKHRWFFEAPDGYVLVSSDKDQLELRIAACRAGVKMLIDEMARPGGDPHTLAASYIYKGFAERSEDERRSLRDMVKNVTYAALYMAQVETVWRTIRERKQLDPVLRAAMTLTETNKIFHGYFGLFPQFQRYHESKLPWVKIHGGIKIEPLGRIRYYPIYPPPFNELANWDIQTEGADHVGSEMVAIRHELNSRFPGEAAVVGHMHDQVVILCKLQHAEEIRKITDRIFGCTPITGPMGVVNLTAKASIGKNLLEAKDPEKYKKKKKWWLGEGAKA